MQGILELPGYLDELQSGMPDSSRLRAAAGQRAARHFGEPALEQAAGAVRCTAVAGPIARWPLRCHRRRGQDPQDPHRAYQQVLLSLLKGGDPARAVDTLRKVAQGMEQGV
jgi:hypothetical protein